MIKRINWDREARMARNMDDNELAYARKGAFETAKLWSDPDTDPDRNNGFYMDQVSVYAAEQARRIEEAASLKARTA